jgi:hypothetical protein
MQWAKTRLPLTRGASSRAGADWRLLLAAALFLGIMIAEGLIIAMAQANSTEIGILSATATSPPLFTASAGRGRRSAPASGFWQAHVIAACTRLRWPTRILWSGRGFAGLLRLYCGVELNSQPME